MTDRVILLPDLVGVHQLGQEARLVRKIRHFDAPKMTSAIRCLASLQTFAIGGSGWGLVGRAVASFPFRECSYH